LQIYIERWIISDGNLDQIKKLINFI